VVKKKRKKKTSSLELCLGEEDVPLDLRVVLDESQLPWKRPGVFPLDVEGARAGGGEELDEERGSLFGAGHFEEEVEEEVEVERSSESRRKKSSEKSRGENNASIRVAISLAIADPSSRQVTISVLCS
jgi:hypothetical protein